MYCERVMRDIGLNMYRLLLGSYELVHFSAVTLERQ